MTRKKKDVWPGGGQILFVADMPKLLMRSFAAWCKLRGVTQKQKLISLIRECVQDTKLPMELGTKKKKKGDTDVKDPILGDEE